MIPLLLALSLTQPLTAERNTPAGSVTLTAVMDRNRLFLSDDLFLTLTVEGPSGFEAVLADQPLVVANPPNWRAVPTQSAVRRRGPRDVVSRTYRVTPFAVGEPLLLAAVSAGGVLVEWPNALHPRVETRIAEDEPIGPVSGIEPFPVPERRFPKGLLVVPVLIGMLLIWRRKQGPTPIVHDVKWASREVAQLTSTQPAYSTLRHILTTLDAAHFTAYLEQLENARYRPDDTARWPSFLTEANHLLEQYTMSLQSRNSLPSRGKP